MSKPLMKHCSGVDPVIRKEGQWWVVTCPKCGKRLGWHHTAFEARDNWNIQMECKRRMKGHEDD